MSDISPSSPEPNAPETVKPEAVEPQVELQTVKPRFADSIWRPILSCGVAALLGLALVPVLLHKPPVPTDSPVEITLDQSQVYQVQLTSEPGFGLLKGQLQSLDSTTSVSAEGGKIVSGVAPVAGAVARLLAEKGDKVVAGQPILEISSGGAVRAAPGAERQQSAAEKQQVAAAKQQEDLARKIQATQPKIEAADARVVAAQQKVDAAREVLARLGRGEKITLETPEFPAEVNAPNSARPAKKSGPNSAQSAVLREAQVAEREAKNADAALEKAKSELKAAEAGAKAAPEKLKAAAIKLGQIEDDFDAKRASGAEVEAARSDASDARAEVAASATRVAAAREAAAKREATALAARARAVTARVQAAKVLSDIKVFAKEETTAEPTKAPAKKPTAPVGTLTMRQAVRQAQAALEESQRAAREAEKLHAEIEGYQRLVNASNSRIAKATQNLQAAQQNVLDSVPRPNFTAVKSPVDGVISWVPPLAREVNVGQAVFGVQASDDGVIAPSTQAARQYKVRIEDRAGLWRGIKIGAVLPAVIAPKSAGDSPIQSAALPDAPTQAKNVVASARVLNIAAPDTSAEPAYIAAMVTPLASDPTPLRAGLPLMISVPRPGEQKSLSIPLSAILIRNDKRYVAVLEALNGPVAASTPTDAEGNLVPIEPATLFEAKWQEITVGKGDEVRQTVSAGLNEGQQIVLQPELLLRSGAQEPGETLHAPLLVRVAPGV